MNNLDIIDYFMEHDLILFPNTHMEYINTNNQDSIRKKYFAECPTPDITKNIINNTDWLIDIDEPNIFTPVGHYKEKDCIIYFDKSGILRFAAKNIQDIPFLIYGFNHGYPLTPYSDEEKEKENELEHLKNLNIYSNWCSKNNIELDPLHLHHDENGNIINSLSKLYQYERLHYNLIFPTKEEQELIDE